MPRDPSGHRAHVVAERAGGERLPAADMREVGTQPAVRCGAANRMAARRNRRGRRGPGRAAARDRQAALRRAPAARARRRSLICWLGDDMEGHQRVLGAAVFRALAAIDAGAIGAGRRAVCCARESCRPCRRVPEPRSCGSRPCCRAGSPPAGRAGCAAHSRAARRPSVAVFVTYFPPPLLAGHVDAKQRPSLDVRPPARRPTPSACRKSATSRAAPAGRGHRRATNAAH